MKRGRNYPPSSAKETTVKQTARDDRPRPIMRRFAVDRRGGIGMLFSLALIPLLGCIALAVDVSTWHAARTQLQKIADGAAIVSARELRIGTVSSDVLQEAARLYAQTVIAAGANFVVDAQVTAEVSQERDSVTVAVASKVSPIFSSLFNTGLTEVEVRATALLAGREPICMISTARRRSKGLSLRDAARLEAEDCGIYVDSGAADALHLDAGVQVRASLICVNGGVASSSSQVTPAPVTGCPRIGDPLEHRANAVTNARICALDEEVYRVRGRTILYPGEYCGGIDIGSAAHIAFMPGTYHIGGEGIRVDSGARLTATDVSFVFHEGAGAYFGADSTLHFSASREGPLAGILFIETSTGRPGTFRISSNDARTLLGTIYLPRSTFVVDADRPVAGESAYTVVVAREIRIAERSQLVLNTDYAATDVPVPDGVGPHSEIILSQ
jgi:Flp pilus assembly protein TadG